MGEPADTRITELVQEVKTLRGQKAILTGELDKVRAERDYLRTLALPREEALTEDTPQPKRRERVPGEPNIYQRLGRDGTVVFEVGFTEGGKQRWSTVGPDLTEAIAFRDSLRAAGRVKAPAPA